MTDMAAGTVSLAMRQILAVQLLEIRKRFIGKRAIPVYLLVMIPLMIFGARTLALLLFHVTQEGSLPSDRVLYAVLFRTLIIRFVVYFGCVAVFVPLFRGDVLDKSLHYYFLAPIRRSRLVVAKYLSGITAAVVLWNGVTLSTWLLFYLARGPAELAATLASGHGWLELGAYLLVTTMACIGYGAVFLLAGVALRSPIVPALAILGWESINALLPPFLKAISVIHYLEALCPVSIPPDSGIEILADPASPWVAIPGLLVLAGVLLALAARKARTMEILYGTE